jgi:type I restriction enzyme R subunit
MIENLSIDTEDFDVMPILANAGGWNRANKTFAGRLQETIGNLNKAVAA